MINVDKFIYRLGSPNNRLGRPPKFYRSSDLIAGGCKFASVYAVTVEDAHSIEEAGTAAGYKGVVWSQRLWVDFDDDGAARAAQSSLKEQGIDHVVFSTGGRGCHIGITRLAKPSHTLPLQDKEWVKANLPGADLSLYWHLHLIRLPGTLHDRTGLPKRLLYSHEGRHITLPPYTPTEETPSDVGMDGNANLFNEWEIMSRLAPIQHRHDLVKLTAALREGGATVAEAKGLLSIANRGYKAPLSTAEIDRMIQWAYNG